MYLKGIHGTKSKQSMSPDTWSLYGHMFRSRLFEEASARLWHDGLISGELHAGTGEEAIVAGIVPQLKDGDSMALDHRGTAALLMRGVDPAAILRELLGHPEGLCGGMGGHMHLFSKAHLAASSGIVGASGPAAAGFALASRYLRPGAVTLAFFGEGSMNQGMLMESLNLASAWNLPVVFVCKDDSWSITTESATMTGGDLKTRAEGLGVPYLAADGLDVEDMWRTAHSAIEKARSGLGPTFLHARCVHLEGHFLGYQMKRMVDSPLKDMPEVAVPLTRSFLKSGGASLGERLKAVKTVMASVSSALRESRRTKKEDPIVLTRAKLASDPDRLRALEKDIETDINQILETVLAEETL